MRYKVDQSAQLSKIGPQATLVPEQPGQVSANPASRIHYNKGPCPCRTFGAVVGARTEAERTILCRPFPAALLAVARLLFSECSGGLRDREKGEKGFYCTLEVSRMGHDRSCGNILDIFLVCFGVLWPSHAKVGQCCDGCP